MGAIAPKPTVIIDMTIEISTSGEIDTGISVEKWNAMSAEDRANVVREIWIDEASSYDNGGITVITDGAAEA
jgi:hypothetical protein